MNNELPIGFMMALAENPDAMQRFSGMSKAEQARYTDRARHVGSREDMHALVAEISPKR